MSRILSFTGVGLLAACLTLSAPSVGHAQYYRPAYGYGGYSNYGYRGYSGYGSRGYGAYSGYRGYGSRPAVVHPQSLYWTPYRGLHTHGHTHVPHRGHYHAYRY